MLTKVLGVRGRLRNNCPDVDVVPDFEPEEVIGLAGWQPGEDDAYLWCLVDAGTVQAVNVAAGQSFMSVGAWMRQAIAAKLEARTPGLRVVTVADLKGGAL